MVIVDSPAGYPGSLTTHLEAYTALTNQPPAPNLKRALTSPELSVKKSSSALVRNCHINQVAEVSHIANDFCLNANVFFFSFIEKCRSPSPSPKHFLVVHFGKMPLRTTISHKGAGGLMTRTLYNGDS